MPCEEIVSNCALFLRFLDPPLQCCLDIQEEPGPPSNLTFSAVKDVHSSHHSPGVTAVTAVISTCPPRHSVIRLGGQTSEGKDHGDSPAWLKAWHQNCPPCRCRKFLTLFIQTVVHSCILCGRIRNKLHDLFLANHSNRLATKERWNCSWALSCSHGPRRSREVGSVGSLPFQQACGRFSFNSSCSFTSGEG